MARLSKILLTLIGCDVMRNPSSSSVHLRRDDIQGFRVISALLVFSFHVLSSGVSGGVDAFFVISGYFLASNAVQRDQLTAPQSVFTFYRTFLLRVAPQAAVALIGILLLLFLFISPTVWAKNLHDIGASALYFENIRLIDRGQDYLARSESLTLVQHFWAVSLIGQTYLIWPFVLRLNSLLVHGFGQNPRRMLSLLIAILSLTSFFWGIYFTHTSPASAYFDFFSRFWEFGCGVLLGLWNFDTTPKCRHSTALSWLGVILLLTCGITIGSELAFPGYASMWPVAGALLFIRYGCPNTQFNASWIMSRPRLARLGDLSFGVYLWHWPLYVVYINSTNYSGAVPLMSGLGLLAMSFGCAVLSKKVVDWYFSFRKISSSTTLVPLGFLSLLLAISWSSELVRRQVSWKGPSWDSRNIQRAGFTIPGPFSVRDDSPPTYKNGCHQNGTSDELKTCRFGSPDAKKKIVLVGGSHSAHWLPALSLHAEKEGWEIISMTKSACLFADPSDDAIFSTRHISCSAWNVSAMRAIKEIKPDLVITLATRYQDTHDGRSEYVPHGYISLFRQLEAEGIYTLALRDTPWMRKDVPVCVYSPVVNDKDICGEERRRVLNDIAYTKAIRELPRSVRVVDLSAQFCDKVRCWAVKDGISIYRDSNHITATFAERISPALRDAVDAAWIARGQY